VTQTTISLPDQLPELRAGAAPTLRTHTATGSRPARRLRAPVARAWPASAP
jgi:hypothetical protein